MTIPSNPEKISGFELKPMYAGDLVGRDDFTTYTGWSTLESSGASPTIAAEGGYLKITFTAAGMISIGKFTSPLGKNKVVKAKVRIRSYTGTVAVDIGIFQDIDNAVHIGFNEAANRPRCIKELAGSASTPAYGSTCPAFTTGVAMELMLYVARGYFALYWWDGSKWKRGHAWFTTLPSLSPSVTAFIRVSTGTGCEVWFDYVEMAEAVGEGLKDPFFIRDKSRKIWRDPQGYSYFLPQGSAGSNFNGIFAYQYGQGVQLVYKTKKIEDASAYQYFGKIFNVHICDGDAIIEGITIYIFVCDYTGGGPSAGIRRFRISVSDFLAKNFGAAVDDGLIIAGSNVRGVDLLWDDSGFWYLTAQHGDGNHYLYKISSLAGTPTLLGKIKGVQGIGTEHLSLVDKENGLIHALLAASGGNNFCDYYIINPSTLSATKKERYYVDPNFTISETYYPVFEPRRLFAPYISYRGAIQGETFPSEADWFVYSLGCDHQKGNLASSILFYFTSRSCYLN